MNNIRDEIMEERRRMAIGFMPMSGDTYWELYDQIGRDLNRHLRAPWRFV